ncbi:MAG: hypothetical protein QXQ81_06800 [Candidatus Thorarchaeota archaeon]
MSDDTSLPGRVRILRPDQLPAGRPIQPSVASHAQRFLESMRRARDMRSILKTTGLSFGGRVLLVGPPSSDFEGFAYHLAIETPMTLAQVRLGVDLTDSRLVLQLITLAIETARRNSPAVLFLPSLDLILSLSPSTSAAMTADLLSCSWDDDDVVIVTCTSRPSSIPSDTLAAFDRSIVLERPQLSERQSIMSQFLKSRPNIDVAVVADLTDGWGYTDLKRLAAVLLIDLPDDDSVKSRERIEEMIVKSTVRPLDRPEVVREIEAQTIGGASSDMSSIEVEYPDDFLSQLYLMAVSEDYVGTLRVVEQLNSRAPLGPAEMSFLSRYPFLLVGRPEERMARLMTAKKTRDRITRVLGRYRG